MKNALMVAMLLSQAPTALAEPFYCYARPVIVDGGERFLRIGPTLDSAKNAARNACKVRYPQGQCEVTDCYKGHPYQYQCTSGDKSGVETNPGGFTTYGNDIETTKKGSVIFCENAHGAGGCITLCFPNFSPLQAVSIK